MQGRSSTIAYSLLVVDSYCGHNWGLCCSQMEQAWSMWWIVCSASLQSQSAESINANSLQVCSQATVSCSQPEYSDLLMSCQMVNWVSRGVVVSSGPSPLTSSTVLEQGFGFLIGGGGTRVATVCSQTWPGDLLF